MRIWVTRPKEDGAALSTALQGLGHQTVLSPLLNIKPVVGAKAALNDLDLKIFQGLLVTSANGIRAFSELTDFRDVDLYCVGAGSAHTARDLGFIKVKSANGDVDTLFQLINKSCKTADGAFLHVAGTKLAGDLGGQLAKAGFTYQRVVLYEAQKTEKLDDAMIKSLKKGEIDAVCLFSPRTAETFATLVDVHQLETYVKNIVIYGLSAAVAAKIKHLPSKAVHIASSPDQESLLDIIKTTGDTSMTTPSDDKKTDPKIEKDTPPKSTASPLKPTDAKPAVAGKKDEKPSKDPAADALKKAADKPAPKKGSLKAKLLLGAVVIIAGAGASAYFTKDMWIPKVKSEIATYLDVKTPVDPAVAATLKTLEARLAELESKPVSSVAPMMDMDHQGMVDRLSAMESQIAELTASLSSIQIANGDESKLEEIKAAVARLQAIEMPQPIDISALEEENKRLLDVVDVLTLRIDQLEAAGSNFRSEDNKAHALMAGLSNLREVVRTSSSYVSELDSLKVLAAGNDELMVLLDALSSGAENGVASLSALRSSFETAAKNIVRAVAVPEGAGWMEQTVANITSLVSIRRAPDNLDGDGPLGIVARAEHNVRNGDFAGAIDELDKLEGNPKEAAQGWIDAVQARLNVNASLAAVQAHVLTMMGNIGGQG